MESELFGYEKGAFTGAVKQTKGKIEAASAGTFFLDEIGDMPMPLQAKMKPVRRRTWRGMAWMPTKMVAIKMRLNTFRS